MKIRKLQAKSFLTLAPGLITRTFRVKIGLGNDPFLGQNERFIQDRKRVNLPDIHRWGPCRGRPACREDPLCR